MVLVVCGQEIAGDGIHAGSIEKDGAGVGNMGLGDNESDCVIRMGAVARRTVDADLGRRCRRVIRVLKSGGVEVVPCRGLRRRRSGMKLLGGRDRLLDSATMAIGKSEEAEDNESALRH